MKTKKLLVVTAFIACGFTANAQDTIRMTFVEEVYYMYSKRLKIAATPNEKFIIDWGNGYDVDTVTGTGGEQTFILTYNNNYTQYTITITGLTNDCPVSVLECSDLNLTSLNIKGCSSLQKLFCCNNQLTNLDVSNSPSLLYLYCWNNLLVSLDVSNSPSLCNLNCDDNQLTFLDVSNCSSLGQLYCANNKLTNLDVSTCSSLKSLNCENNQLNSLIISNKVYNIYCSNNCLQLSNLYNFRYIRNKLFETQRLYPREVKLYDTVDFSLQAVFDGDSTVFKVERNGSPALSNHYSLRNGILRVKDTGNYTVTMTNNRITSMADMFPNPDVPAKVIAQFNVIKDTIPDTDIIKTELSPIIQIYPNPTSYKLQVTSYKLRATYRTD